MRSILPVANSRWLKFCLSKKTYTLSRINRLDLSVDFLSFCLGNVWSFRDFTW